jgi:hypothetical protein
MNSVCHDAVLCCAMLCYAVVFVGPELLCALSAGIVEGEEKSSNRAMGVVKGSQAVVVHVCDGGVSLGVLGEANKAETTAATGVTVLDDNLRMSV